MRPNTRSSYALATSAPYQLHTSARIIETSLSLRWVIHNPLGKTNGTWHRKSKVIQLPRQLLKATGLFVHCFEFRYPGLDALPTGSRDQ
jgi:hypothetical protein